jgi:putative transposase
MRTSAGRPFRFTTRLQDFTYRGASYFITICSWGHKCTFGRVDDYVVRLSLLGEIIEQEWLKTPLIRPGVILDRHVIMPNHMHAILFVPALLEDRTSRMRMWFAPPRSPFYRQPRSLSSLVGGFKGAVTRAAEKELGTRRPFWQTRFDDRVIRGPRDLARRQAYIAENPATWTADRFHPDQMQKV